MVAIWTPTTPNVSTLRDKVCPDQRADRYKPVPKASAVRTYASGLRVSVGNALIGSNCNQLGPPKNVVKAPLKENRNVANKSMWQTWVNITPLFKKQ